MYEIRCIVGDKQLRDVLVFLNKNNTLEPPVVIPTGAGEMIGSIIDAVAAKQPKATRKKRKKPLQAGGKRLKNKDVVEIVRNHIKQTGVAKISASVMKQITMAAGYSPNAYSHAVKILLADGTICRTKPSGTYKVIKP